MRWRDRTGYARSEVASHRFPSVILEDGLTPFHLVADFLSNFVSESGTTSVGRTAALLGLAPPPEEGIKAGDVDHLDYAELHVPIKIKENTPAPQPQEDTQEWRMLEKVGVRLSLAL